MVRGIADWPSHVSLGTVPFLYQITSRSAGGWAAAGHRRLAGFGWTIVRQLYRWPNLPPGWMRSWSC